MFRVESPFHAIAAQALDDTPDTEINGTAAATGAVAATAKVITSSDAWDQEPDSMKKAAGSSTENERNKNGCGVVGTAEEAEVETAVQQERKGISFEGGPDLDDVVAKKSKKRTNVWTKTTSRKSAKKNSLKNGGARLSDAKDDNVLLKPFHQEDDPAYPILLSKVYKAEKVELSLDRLAASGSKGYRMVRATRGVVQGAWYFEIQVERLGDTGHTRLGWSTRRADLQAPVGYDGHSYAYRDVDGSKVHAALREEYGPAYHEKDVIGFYINLPREAGFTRKAEEVVGYKGQPYITVADEPLKPLPGSEIIFFKNGACQDVAFRDINDGSYFPAASMYTHLSQDCCKLVFNFGPDFKYPPTDLRDRPFPSPMCQASGPGEARAEASTTTQTDVVVDSADNGGGKQRMAPDCNIAGDVEGATTTATKEETAPKDVGKVPLVEKNEKMSKVSVGNHLPPPLYKNSRAGELRVNPEFKRDGKVMAGKNDNARVQLGSTGLPNGKGIQNGIRLTGIQGSKVGFTGAGLSTLKGSKKGATGAASQSCERTKKGKPGTGISSLKEKRLPGLTGNTSGTIETEVQSSKGSKKALNNPGLQSIPGTKKDVTVGGFHSVKGNERDTSGSGLLIPKRAKKGMAGTDSPLKTSKVLAGTGSALKSSRNVLPRAGSVVKSRKKDLPGKGFLPGGSALSGRRTWRDGIRGTTMDVDVVVVESSTSFQAEGSFI